MHAAAADAGVTCRTRKRAAIYLDLNAMALCFRWHAAVSQQTASVELS
jgi:hypothetical protein